MDSADSTTDRVTSPRSRKLISSVPSICGGRGKRFPVAFTDLRESSECRTDVT